MSLMNFRNFKCKLDENNRVNLRLKKIFDLIQINLNQKIVLFAKIKEKNEIIKTKIV